MRGSPAPSGVHYVPEPDDHVESLWNDDDAARFEGALAQRVYTSRLLGCEPSLVLHGGGNTSVKLTEPDLFGEPVDLLYVKGSGWDLASIEEAGFAPVRMRELLRLAQLEVLTDSEMARQLRTATVDPRAPAPSVEAILHAVLPFPFVDHTHPDALLSVMNTPSGRERVQEIYGDEVAVVPYVMPGFLLARQCAQELPEQLRPDTRGVVLMQHGLVTFGERAREAYERMIDLVARAEDYLREHDAWVLSREPAPAPGEPLRVAIAELRRDASLAVGRPLVVARSVEPSASAFASRDDLERVSQQGPATPDHVIRTKRVPLLGRDVESYVAAYRRYFEVNAARHPPGLRMLDPAPRVVIDSELGLLTVGRTAADAALVEDLYLRTIDVIERADRLEEWKALPEGEVFDVEYWDLEQAKLRSESPLPPFAGEVALVTGAASGIGKACVHAFLEAGAAVVGLDISENVHEISHELAYLGLVCDVAQQEAGMAALEAGARRYGGLDMLVLNAGVFPSSAPISELSTDEWRRTMQVNLDANAALLRDAFPLLRLAPSRGRVVVNASKNVPAPGPGAAAYSASKAALTQLARVAALEWGTHGVRVNVVHPNAVYDTGIWTDEVLARRAESYGLSVERYRRNNVLGVEVASMDVARMIVAMCGPAFDRTTGAQVPVDGGNERVI
jgi:rhamnose utilization protein RhaD (predicted bifunctional aldolase and dehydrogenase)/NAD(P)-dependent dehydrogenase (short-subunit alcohol dehydrogenase family)